MPDVIRISLTFILILLLLRKKMPVGYVLAIAATGLMLLYRMDMQSIVMTFQKTAANRTTVMLWLSLSFIRTFEMILRERNILSTMMSSVKAFISNRKIVIISMPMLIGMLPSLGGAYFSAPMVKEATSGLHMQSEEKAFINYWFRHPWEYVLPLYPGVLLASAISGIALYDLVAANTPYAAMVIFTGFLYSMRSLSPAETHVSAGNKHSAGSGISAVQALVSFLPVFSVLLMVMLLRIELHYALLALITLLLIIYRYAPKEILRILRHGFALDVIVLIAGIMFFKETMEMSGAVRNLSAFFVSHGIPVLPIICFLPFLTGLLTGLTVGFVGSTFPLLINIAGGASLQVISMAFAAGFIGVLLSPVHLCLVLTREYFKADMWGVYKKIIPSCVYIFLVAFIEYMLLK